MHDSVLLETTRQLIVVYVYGSRPKTCVWFSKSCFSYVGYSISLGVTSVWSMYGPIW
jgi:hypothetical protein